jgi:uncharacterized membrane protein
MARPQSLARGAFNSEPIPAVHRIGVQDLFDCLRKGVDDFLAMPSHVVFLTVIYPLAGLIFARLAFGYDLLPLVYPLAAGFALVGPVAAIGVYELSRRREKGLRASWREAFSVLRSRSLPAIAALAAVLMALFALWLLAAQSIYEYAFGGTPPISLAYFVNDLFTTSEGWKLILIGNAVGFLFAVAAFSISVVSFPLLIDRRVSFSAAVATSLEAVRVNPSVMAVWAIIIAALLFIGSLPLLVGLAVVLPVLGHATWHLYRKVVDADGSPRPGLRPRNRSRRFAADFPSVLVPWAR